MKFVPVVERVLLTAWVGGTWAIGYIAAPTLFAVLDDRKLAGQLAGEMFHAINWLGMVSAVLLLLIVIKRCGKIWQLWVLLLMLVLVLNNEFVLQPMMAELKAQGLPEGSAAKSRFGMLHGISSVAYLVVSLLGLVLVAVGIRKPGIDS